jgi:hypothetical protein
VKTILSAIARGLDVLPGWLWAIAWGGAMAAMLVATSQLKTERLAHAQTRLVYAQQTEAMARAASKAQDDYRRLENSLTTRILEDALETESTLAAARAETDAARAVGERLRQQLTALALASCSPASVAAAASPGPAADAARDLLADVQRRLDQATDDIARFADQASAAGALCERSYGRAKSALNPQGVTP